MLIDEGLLNENAYAPKRYVIMHEQSLVTLLKEHDLLYLCVAILTYIVLPFIFQMNNLKTFLVYASGLIMSVDVLKISITIAKHFVRR